MDALTNRGTNVVAKAKRRLTFKQRILVVLAGVAVLAIFAYGYYWWTVGRFIQTTDDAYVGGNVTPVSPHVSGFVAESWSATTNASRPASC